MLTPMSGPLFRHTICWKIEKWISIQRVETLRIANLLRSFPYEGQRNAFNSWNKKEKKTPFNVISSIFYEIRWLSVSGKEIIIITISANWLYKIQKEIERDYDKRRLGSHTLPPYTGALESESSRKKKKKLEGPWWWCSTSQSTCNISF